MPIVIREGTKKATKYRSNCAKCGCVAEYDEKEVNFDGGQPSHSPTAKCPQCGNEVSVNRKDPFADYMIDM